MNAVTDIKPDLSHKSIASALASAQSHMGKALKSANNPHFKSKYADLASVVDACMPALNDCGIAVIQPTFDDDTGRYVKTILIHGETGETLECRVPLIVGKNDMQGYGSAVTYARRYGLMSMTGIAPEDDDGHAASKSPPVVETAPKKSAHEITRDGMLVDIRNVGAETVSKHPKFIEDIAALKAAAPELAAQVEAEIETQLQGAAA